MSNNTKQDKVHPHIKVQPPLLALVHFVLAYLLEWFIPLPIAISPKFQFSGFVLVVIGFLLGLGALFAFRRTRAKQKTRGSTVRLVTTGIYHFTRNPVYLGFLLMLIGLLLNRGSVWGFIIAPLMIILFNRLVIEEEEADLAGKFGDEYSKYKSRVRRWI